MAVDFSFQRLSRTRETSGGPQLAGLAEWGRRVHSRKSVQLLSEKKAGSSCQFRLCGNRQCASLLSDLDLRASFRAKEPLDRATLSLPSAPLFQSFEKNRLAPVRRFPTGPRISELLRAIYYLLTIWASGDSELSK